MSAAESFSSSSSASDNDDDDNNRSAAPPSRAPTLYSRPPLPPAHSRALSSLRAAVANNELDENHENYSLEAFAAGSNNAAATGSRGRLHQLRVQRELLERSQAVRLALMQRGT